MNRNLLKWILIAVVILGAAGYLILSEMPSGKKSSHPKGKKEQVVTGHSKPFKIEPVEGITISAPKNALDKDREFDLTPVDDKTYDKVMAQLEESDVRPLMVFELDAGLKPDDRLPGDYEVTMDLDGMGIPRCLHDNVAILRGTGSDKELAFSEYNTHVKDGKLTFRSNRNSKLILGLRHRPEFILKSFYHMYFKNPLTYFQEAMSTWGSGAIETIHMYYDDPTYITILVEHESGNFRLHFRFKDTENAQHFDKYCANDKAFEKRINELEKEAHRLWKAKVQEEVEKNQKGDKNFSFFKWAFSDKQVDAIKAGIKEETILDSLVSKDVKDGELARLQADPNGNLPESIENIINQIIRANQYLDAISLHKLDMFIDIFLVDDWATKAEGSAKTYWVYDGYMFLNYKYYFDKGPDKTQVTFVHELGHLRQQGYYGMSASREAQEATIVVLERDAARQWHKDGFFEADPESIESEAAYMTGRDAYQYYGYPLDKAFNTPSDCYTLASAIEGIREGVGKKSTNMSSFISSFKTHGPHKNSWTEWIKWSLDIDDEQLNKGWEHFAAKNLVQILPLQRSAVKLPKDVATIYLDLKPDNPVEQLQNKRFSRDYAVNTFWLNITPQRTKGKAEEANVFVYCKEKEPNPYVSFYWSDYRFNECYVYKRDGNSWGTHLSEAKPSLFYAGNRATDYDKKRDGSYKLDPEGNKIALSPELKSGYQLAVVTTSQSKGPKCNYYVVALFKPEAPEIRKVKEDQITFIVPKPARALTKEKLITGVVVTYKDKNGKEITREIEPKNFGKKATWTLTGCSKKGNSFTLSAHWYYKLDEQTTYVSPESDPAQWGAKGDQPEEEEIVLTKEPETNYWKQVSSRMTMKNTSIDVDQSNDDEVSSDYRSIDLQAAKTGRSLEFTGMGATEEKTKENGRVYVQDIFIEGTLTYTEPPKFWIPTQQYKAHWEIADDPYLTKVEDPFVFEAKNTSSDQAACAQSKKDKIDNGRSPVGKANWLRGAYTTFEARYPEKNGPKSFTLTQTYSIKERQGSDLMATVTFVYNYEWVGEEEPEPEVEEETVPEGGCWKLVKTETNDSHMTFKTKNGTTATISGGAGEYTVHIDYVGNVDVKTDRGWMMTQEKDLIATVDRRMHFDTPKSFYLPGEKGPGYVIEEVQKENKRRGSLPPRESSDYYPSGYIEIKNDVRFEYERINTIIYNAVGLGDRDAAKKRKEIKGGFIPTPWGDMNGFKIFLLISTQFPECYMTKTYTYEWVDGGKKAEPVKEPAKEKPITGGHWKLIHTGVSTEQGMITGSAKGITIQGSNGHYTAHVERDGMISDREINFEKPKSVYMPGEEITLKVTNEKPKIKGGKEGMSYGDIVFSTGQWDGCVEYEGDWDDKPSYSNKKVVGVAKGSAPSKPGTPGAVGFFITEYIKVYGSMSKISTTYNYAWEE